MRWPPPHPAGGDGHGRRLPRGVLQKRVEKQRAAAKAAAEAGDAAALLEALGRQAEAHRDLEQWRQAIDAWQQMSDALGDDAELDDRVRPHAYASDAARELEDWGCALEHALWIDALAGAAESTEFQEVANAAVVAVRQKIGLKAFAELLDETLPKLPEALREKVRREAHCNPTVTRAEDDE